MITSLAIGVAVSQETCESKAVDKAVDKDGKKLAGAAKNSFMKECESGP